ncbi:endonuclease [Yersinia phage fHe-Yen9-02]|nr:endonuclease [Yersinia phage fHe-Yen9-02]
MHYSVSKAEFVPSDVLPDQNSLGLSKMKLRAHSDYYHNNRVNDWAMRFTEFDIMCESKAKNQASTELYTKYLSSNRAK